MPKRKREPEADNLDEFGRRRQIKGLDDKLSRGKKTLQRALKLARAFERQKLSRRLKTATEAQNEEDVSRIKSEIDAIKTVDLSSSAQSHLYKTLLKDKRLAKSTDLLPGYVQDGVKQTPNAATANVLARMYNSSQVKDAMAQVLPGIRAALGVFDSSTKNAKSAPPRPHLNGKREIIEHNAEKERRFDDEPKPPNAVSSNGPIKGDEVSDYKDYYDGRIASSSSTSPAPPSKSLRESPNYDPIPTANSPQYDPARDFSLTTSPSRSPSPPPPTKGRAKNTASSTFLPSLTMGGYISASDGEDFEDETPAGLAPRKNRRGQRARQAIWEQKYGGGAKHLRSQRDPAGARDVVWDARRGAQEVSGGRSGARGGKRKERDKRPAGVASGGNAGAVSGKRLKPQPEEEKAMHPSWEAARKAKEAKQTAVFAGKKVVFD